MKHVSTLLLFLGLSTCLMGQEFSYKYFDFSSDADTCAQGGEAHLFYDDWEVYQTLNNAWDGEKDTTQCIFLQENVFGQHSILLNSFDYTRPIFIRYKTENHDPIYLDNDNQYSIEQYFSSFGAPLLQGVDSVGHLNSGLLMGVYAALNDSVGAMRHYEFDGSTCLTTEHMDTQRVEYLCFKLSFGDVADPDAAFINNPYLAFEYYTPGSFEPDLRTEILFSDQLCLENYCYVESENMLIGETPIFLLQNTESLPGLDNTRQIECRPEPNAAEQLDIDLLINYSFVYTPTILSQPFTEIIGGLVEGSDTLRHTVNIIDNDLDGCFYFMDVFLNAGVTYRFQKSVERTFRQHSACLMLKGGSVELAPNIQVGYGADGIGALGMAPGATLHLGEGSTMTINNRLVLCENTGKDEEQAWVYLPVGSKLVFSELGSLSKWQNKHGHMRLNVLMQGGELDDSKLSPEERVLIRRIYPSAMPYAPDNLNCFPNPAIETCWVTWVHGSDAGSAELSLYSMTGQMVMQQSFTLEKGVNAWPLDTTNFGKGLYLLAVKTPQGIVTQKLLFE